MLDTTEVAYAKFQTKKEHGEFIYEMRLIRLDLTSECMLQRRWYYQNTEDQPDWKKPEDWNLKDKKKFSRKFVQKKDIMKFDLVESRGLNELGLE